MRPLRSRRVAGLVPATLLLALSACDASEGAEPRVLPGSAVSLEALAETAWSALVAGDTAAMEGLRLTEEEHRDLVWPELPASAPALNYPADIAWENIQRRNAAALERLLPRFRGSGYRLEAVRCVGEPRGFASFGVRTDCWVRVRPAGALGEEVQLFKDVLVWGGEHKVFRYYAD